MANVLDGVVDVPRTGCPWKAKPPEFGSSPSAPGGHVPQAVPASRLAVDVRGGCRADEQLGLGSAPTGGDLTNAEVHTPGREQ